MEGAFWRGLSRLLIQPIVENAIAHGLDFENGPARVLITAERRADDRVLIVTDNGNGLPEGDLREGTGLRTTRNRLQQLYGGGGGLSVESRPEGGTSVRITLPFRRAAASGPALAPG